MAKRTWALPAALALLTPLVACGDSTGNAAEGEGDAGETITLKATSLYGPESLETQAEEAYAEAVTEATDGRVKFEWYYADSLVPVDETHTALKDGLIDLAIVLPGYDPAAMPVGNWYQALAAGVDQSIPAGVLQGAGAVADFAYDDESVQKEWENGGMKLLAPTHIVWYWDLLCKDEPVRTLAEAQGKRVRVSNEVVAHEAEAAGMVPVFLAGGEIYEAFQRGVVDCLIQHAPSYIDLGTWDIAKHHTSGLFFTGLTGYNLATSLQTWEKLSAEDRQAMIDAVPVYLDSLYSGYFSQQKKFFTEGVDKGIEFHTASDDLRSAIAEHQDEVLANLAAQAPREVLDPEKSVESYLAAFDEWSEIISRLDYEEHETWQEWLEANPEGTVDMGPWVEAFKEHALPQLR